MTNIALVDDHLLFRKGLATIINSFPEYQIIIEASSGKEFTTLISPSNMPAMAIGVARRLHCCDPGKHGFASPGASGAVAGAA